MISANMIFAAMSDARPGRFYSVDELAAMLGVQDRTQLREQLRIMAGDAGLHSSFKLLKGPSDEFYQRVSFASPFTFCAAWAPNVSETRAPASGPKGASNDGGQSS
jgi:hypothetical protein